jgi:hypothetical protein
MLGQVVLRLFGIPDERFAVQVEMDVRVGIIFRVLSLSIRQDSLPRRSTMNLNPAVDRF